MPTYAIGDVQGCLAELHALLTDINFDEHHDCLWFTGDLVNRGPHSLETLRFVSKLDAVCVLGNHDLHLLATAERLRKPARLDTLDDVLQAPDRPALLDWLRRRPLIHHDSGNGYAIVHAGLPPQWNIHEAIEHAHEVEQILASDRYRNLLEHMYGNQPDGWNEQLQGAGRHRFIINAFTRMRYCDKDGALDFQHKGPPGSEPDTLQPWFDLPARKSRPVRILFGHWASIHHGNINDFSRYNVCPLDTGCVWGDKLTAMRLEDGRFFSVPSQQKRQTDTE